MSEFTRRDLVKIALSVTAAGGAMDAAFAQHVHQAVAADKAVNGGVYTPKLFNEHEYATLRKLAELIVPADDVSPSALESGACEFIDLLASNNDELAARYTGGIAWLDRQMLGRYNANFVDAKPEQQTAMLDLIAFRKNGGESSDLGPGIQFFMWARMMVVDAFYTSKVGIKDVGYMGNKGMAKFEIPQEAIDYALKRSPV
jgi:gluconate 2-dehydrogenase gamma chain